MSQIEIATTIEEALEKAKQVSGGEILARVFEEESKPTEVLKNGMIIGKIEDVRCLSLGFRRFRGHERVGPGFLTLTLHHNYDLFVKAGLLRERYAGELQYELPTDTCDLLSGYVVTAGGTLDLHFFTDLFFQINYHNQENQCNWVLDTALKLREYAKEYYQKPKS